MTRDAGNLPNQFGSENSRNLIMSNLATVDQRKNTSFPLNYLN